MSLARDATDMLMGGTSAMFATIFTNPIEVVKTRLQLQGELKAKGHVVHYRSVPHGLFVVAKNEGLRALQRGLPAMLGFQFCLNTFRLGVFRICERRGLTTDGAGRTSVLKGAGAAGVGGALGSIAGTPFFLVKTRLQAQAGKAISVGHQHQHTGTFEALADIYAKEGFKGLFRGVQPQIPRGAVGSASQMVSFAYAKEWLVSHDLMVDSPILLSFAGANLGGLVMTVCLNPFDVVATRLSNQHDFEEADFWIATRNDYGPLVPQNSSLNVTPSRSTLNKKMRSSKLKSLPGTTIKRPASNESKPLEKKRVKQSTMKAAEPTGAGSQSTNKEPGSSSMPAIIEDGPFIVDIDEDDHAQQNQQSSKNNYDSENRLVIDLTAAQNHLQDIENSSSNFQPQIASIQSLATTSNNREPRADDSTSQHEPESIATELYKKMKGKPSLVAKHPAVEKKMRLENITRKVAILLNIPPSSINQCQPRQKLIILPTNRTNQFVHPGDIPVSSQEIQHVARINIERSHNAFENPRVVLQNIASVVSAPQNLPSSPQQRPNFARQLDGHRNSPAPDQHRQQTRPTLPRSRRSTPLPQETIRNTPSLLFPNLPDSIQRELLATRSNFLSEEEELQGHLAQGTPIVETHPDAIIRVNSGIPVQANLYQNPRMQTQVVDDIGRSPSPSDSGVSMDHDGIFETTNNGNHSQGNLRFVSQQQMKDQFASVSAQMSSTLNYMVNVFENLRTSILETAASYQTLVENMERFNTPENSASQASTSWNVAQEVPRVAEEREIAASESANFNGDQDRNDVVNEAPERNPNSTSRLNLPPEYDPNDTRWTLKHHEHMPGLVELMPHSNIYVNYRELKYCEQTSTDCPSLARRILLEVFSKKAVSVCSSMTEKGHDYSIYPDVRPNLDEHGCLVLLNYILEHGFQCGWKTDLQPILRGLHDKVKEIRFRFGVMSRDA